MYVITGTNRPELSAKISIAGNIANVALNDILIPYSIFGFPLMGLKEVGAALATLTAGMIIGISTFVISKREAGIEFPKTTLLHITTAISSADYSYTS